MRRDPEVVPPCSVLTLDNTLKGAGVGQYVCLVVIMRVTNS